MTDTNTMVSRGAAYAKGLADGRADKEAAVAAEREACAAIACKMYPKSIGPAIAAAIRARKP